MSSKGSYAVVSFCKENGELSVIPQAWLLADGDGKFNRCYWPPFATQESIDKEIHSSTACSILWAQHPIRLMAVADSYPKAVEKLKDAQYTSDLQTEVDEVYQRPKRKRYFILFTQTKNIVLSKTPNVIVGKSWLVIISFFTLALQLKLQFVYCFISMG
ncbi:uncharacterized protein LOC124817092 [Hydra vulgaris]|uniref:uncharacterized protein LOC124817092 n=1 Tax=Hydra vulgaris TaxID=6087 RepID=UPI001F5E6257|nr:uncharacterized protein LOC124817092 [Hydra vulgaris]